MNQQTVTATFVRPDLAPGQARNAAQRFLADCDQLFASGVERIAAKAEPQEDDRSLKQNSFYWGWVLKCISQQAQVNGLGADEDGWHYFYKKNVLGYRVTKVRVPGSKRPVIRRELRSTKGLSVAKFSKYLEAVMAHASTTFGVEFDGKRWEEWQA